MGVQQYFHMRLQKMLDDVPDARTLTEVLAQVPGFGQIDIAGNPMLGAPFEAMVPWGDAAWTGPPPDPILPPNLYQPYFPESVQPNAANPTLLPCSPQSVPMMALPQSNFPFTFAPPNPPLNPWPPLQTAPANEATASVHHPSVEPSRSDRPAPESSADCPEAGRSSDDTTASERRASIPNDGTAAGPDDLPVRLRCRTPTIPRMAT